MKKRTKKRKRKRKRKRKKNQKRKAKKKLQDRKAEINTQGRVANMTREQRKDETKRLNEQIDNYENTITKRKPGPKSKLKSLKNSHFKILMNKLSHM
jgi:hypothetical protein